MNGRSMPRIQPGQKISAAFLNLLSREIERQGRLTGAPGTEVRSNASGVQVRDSGVSWFYARILGGNNPYSWRELIYSQFSEDSEEYAAMTRSGSIATADDDAKNPAYEVNGNAAVPVNTVVRMRRLPGSGDYGFLCAVCNQGEGAVNYELFPENMPTTS